mmetsp:Transcript_55715/g.113448  ORF Transcript_55715/g.113448 Transcript_55715/m.113448 type:complete len:303 (+) Transcript_55715:61-969(+)
MFLVVWCNFILNDRSSFGLGNQCNKSFRAAARLLSIQLAGCILLIRQINARILLKEPSWLELEATHLHIHDWEVLWTHYVRHTERIPHDRILARYWCVVLGVDLQTSAVLGTKHIVTRREALGIVVWGNPQLLGCEVALFANHAVWLGEQWRMGHGNQLVCNGIATSGVDLGWVLDLPNAAFLRRNLTCRSVHAAQLRLHRNKCITTCVASIVCRQLLHIDLGDNKASASSVIIDGGVDACTKHVLVVLGIDTRPHEDTKFWLGLSRAQHVGGQLASQLDIEGDGAVLVQIPVKGVLIVDDR